MYNMSTNNKYHLNVLNHVIKKGVNLIDTAPNYSFGESEKLLGSLWDSYK